MNFEQLSKLADSGQYSRIPISRVLMADLRTPLGLLKALQNVSEHCFLLESVDSTGRWGRYTFLGYDPQMEITCKNHLLTIRHQNGETQSRTVSHPGEEVKKILAENKAPRMEELPSLTGGLVGFFAYDYIRYAEPNLKLSGKGNDFPDMDLMLFDKMLAFDHFKQRLYLIVNVNAEQFASEYERGCRILDEMEAIVRHGEKKKNPGGRLKEALTPMLSKEAFCRRVEKIQHHIHEGDIFQLVYSNPMQAEFEGSILNTYRVLRTTNPSPYMFYFSGSTEIAGASPETLVKVEDRIVKTYPLAGTRRRGATYKEDMELEAELLSDEKERAEHNMLVDLGRNDLGRLCKFGTVRVEKYMSVERFSHVMHIGSEVAGELRDDVEAIDCVDSVLPAGTLSGAPKFRACELIDELEISGRGIYGGAIGYLDFTGNLDVCIAIRLVYKKDNRIYVRSGAGIVADSIPENEYEECINKAKAVVRALKEAEELTE